MSIRPATRYMSWHRHLTPTMKVFILAIALGFRLLVNAVDTPGGCVNAACDYCENLAATCQAQAAATLNGTDCLCTERFKVNLARCLSGQVCAWDGTGSPTPPICPEIYCPGSFDQSFINECPGVSTSLPSAYTGSSEQTSTSSTYTSGPTTGAPSGTDTTTRSSTTGGANSSSSGTSVTGYASAVQVPIGLAGIIAMSSVLLL